MEQLASIVVGVDFSPCSAAAFRQAVRIAAWNRAALLAVHVIDVQVMLSRDDRERVALISSSMTEVARKAWERFAPETPREGVEFQVVVGDARAELNRLVGERKADLLVLGTHGRTHHGRTGTLATNLVRTAPTRVMLVREAHTGSFRSIVACIDFSPTSREALGAASRVAIQDGAALHALHVHQPLLSPISMEGLIMVPPDPAFEEQYRKDLRAQLETFAAQPEPEVKWAKPEIALVEDYSHGAGIIRYANQVQADLVVLGTRGRTTLRDLLMGSTAERVVRDAPCSVLAIKPPQPAKPA